MAYKDRERKNQKANFKTKNRLRLRNHTIAGPKLAKKEKRNIFHNISKICQKLLYVL